MMNTIGTMTYYDPLTGLPNRQYFLDSLEKSLLENSTVILVLVSLRDLSEIKTLVGPTITDGILRSLAETLQTVSDDSLVMGRLADAEFGMIIPSNANGVLRIIDRLDNLLTHPLHFDSNDLNVKVYGGISISEGDDLQADAFFQQAQTALYEAEHSSGEQLKLYNSNTHHALVDRLRFQTEIRNALDKHQLIAFYQPIVDLERNVVVGKEALIRWKHPVRGLLNPAHFLQAAEQGGFIEEIGEYMLHYVCAQHRSWLEQGVHLGWVAVNISANHFRSPHFPELLEELLRTYKLPASLLRIEITEDAMLSPTPDVLRNFEQLKKMGIHVAIDDFGTAYSTLEYLIRYPVETLKIDKAFIDQVDVGFRAQGLVRSIVGMGRNLSMSIVAEGVERASQMHLLQTMDCNEAQGYFFSRPLPAQDYPEVSRQVGERLQTEKKKS
jgi:diguanylate cyclase (GGDEF)-like protein